MKNYLKVLKKCPLFYNVEDESLLKMLTCLGAKVKKYNKKEIVFLEGKTIDKIGIVLSGSAMLTKDDYFGNRSILRSALPSEMFAEAFACANAEVLPLSVITAEPSEILFIDCDHIMHTCQNNCGFHQQLIYNLMKALAEETISFHHRIEITSKRTTREKLLTYLNYESKRVGKQSFSIPFNRQELADYLEVDRSGLSSEIGKLRSEGVLESRKNQFKLL